MGVGGGDAWGRAVTFRMTWPFGDLQRGAYGTILADPPWQFKLRSVKGEGKSPQAHYGCMDLDAIKALPVADLCLPHAICAMWATAPMLDQAFDVMAAWGFRFVTAGAWAKQSKTGEKWSFGTGFRYRSAAEFWLLGVRGSPPTLSRSVRNLIVSPVREHSRKPDRMRADLQLIGAGPYCELFARESAAGWDSWGNESGKFDQPMMEVA